MRITLLGKDQYGFHHQSGSGEQPSQGSHVHLTVAVAVTSGPAMVGLSISVKPIGSTVVSKPAAKCFVAAVPIFLIAETASSFLDICASSISFLLLSRASLCDSVPALSTRHDSRRTLKVLLSGCSKNCFRRCESTLRILKSLANLSISLMFEVPMKLALNSTLSDRRLSRYSTVRETQGWPGSDLAKRMGPTYEILLRPLDATEAPSYVSLPQLAPCTLGVPTSHPPSPQRKN